MLNCYPGECCFSTFYLMSLVIPLFLLLINMGNVLNSCVLKRKIITILLITSSRCLFVCFFCLLAK